LSKNKGYFQTTAHGLRLERESHCPRPVGFFLTRRVEKKHQPDFDPTGFDQPGGSGVQCSVFKRSVN